MKLTIPDAAVSAAVLGMLRRGGFDTRDAAVTFTPPCQVLRVPWHETVVAESDPPALAPLPALLPAHVEVDGLALRPPSTHLRAQLLEVADWCRAAGFEEQAARVEVQPITDPSDQLTAAAYLATLANVLRDADLARGARAEMAEAPVVESGESQHRREEAARLAWRAAAALLHHVEVACG